MKRKQRGNLKHAEAYMHSLKTTNRERGNQWMLYFYSKSGYFKKTAI